MVRCEVFARPTSSAGGFADLLLIGVGYCERVLEWLSLYVGLWDRGNQLIMFYVENYDVMFIVGVVDLSCFAPGLGRLSFKKL